MEIDQNINDLCDRKDIEKLVDSFYSKVLADEIIGFIFTDVVKLDWKKHIPLMYDFWETTLFHKTIYKGNPLAVHIELNKKIKLEKKHFDRWLMLFNQTVDTLFKGNNAEQAKVRALSIATIIQIKIQKSFE